MAGGWRRIEEGKERTICRTIIYEGSVLYYAIQKFLKVENMTTL